jgi:hypothetical protein
VFAGGSLEYTTCAAAKSEIRISKSETNHKSEAQNCERIACLSLGLRFRVSASQNLRIGLTLISVLLRGQHVVSEPAQFFDYGKREILIGVELHPGSLHDSLFASFVFPDGPINFIHVGRGVLPGCFKVGRSQPRIIPKEVRIGPPQPVMVHQNPDGNSGIPDARIAAASVRLLGNPASRDF